MRAGSTFVVTFTVLGCAAAPAHAQLQRWVDERGVIHYADAASRPPRTLAAATLAQPAVSAAAVAPRPLASGKRAAATAALLPGSPSSVDRATAGRLPRSFARAAADASAR